MQVYLNGGGASVNITVIYLPLNLKTQIFVPKDKNVKAKRKNLILHSCTQFVFIFCPTIRISCAKCGMLYLLNPMEYLRLQ